MSKPKHNIKDGVDMTDGGYKFDKDDPIEYPFSLHCRGKTRDEFYTRLRTLIPEDLFTMTKLTTPVDAEMAEASEIQAIDYGELDPCDKAAIAQIEKHLKDARAVAFSWQKTAQDRKDIIDRQAKQIKAYTHLNETVAISCTPPSDCNDPMVLKKYMKACLDAVVTDEQCGKD